MDPQREDPFKQAVANYNGLCISVAREHAWVSKGTKHRSRNREDSKTFSSI